jgi:hypothetical protein
VQQDHCDGETFGDYQARSIEAYRSTGLQPRGKSAMLSDFAQTVALNIGWKPAI